MHELRWPAYGHLALQSGMGRSSRGRGDVKCGSRYRVLL